MDPKPYLDTPTPILFVEILGLQPDDLAALLEVLPDLLLALARGR